MYFAKYEHVLSLIYENVMDTADVNIFSDCAIFKNKYIASHNMIYYFYFYLLCHE